MSQKVCKCMRESWRRCLVKLTLSERCKPLMKMVWTVGRFHAFELKGFSCPVSLITVLFEFLLSSVWQCRAGATSSILTVWRTVAIPIVAIACSWCMCRLSYESSQFHDWRPFAPREAYHEWSRCDRCKLNRFSFPVPKNSFHSAVQPHRVGSELKRPISTPIWFPEILHYAAQRDYFLPIDQMARVWVQCVCWYGYSDWTTLAQFDASFLHLNCVLSCELIVWWLWPSKTTMQRGPRWERSSQIQLQFLSPSWAYGWIRSTWCQPCRYLVDVNECFNSRSGDIYFIP